MNLLILEGTDRSGKSTLDRAVSYATSYQWFISDRWFHSHLVYGAIEGRYRVDAENVYMVARKTLLTFENVLVVICEPPAIVIANRRIVEDPTLLSKVTISELAEDVNRQQLYFREAVKMLPYPYTMVVDTNRNIDEVVQNIADMMAWLERGAVPMILEGVVEGYQLIIKETKR